MKNRRTQPLVLPAFLPDLRSQITDHRSPRLVTDLNSDMIVEANPVV